MGTICIVAGCLFGWWVDCLCTHYDDNDYLVSIDVPSINDDGFSWYKVQVAS